MAHGSAMERVPRGVRFVELPGRGCVWTFAENDVGTIFFGREDSRCKLRVRVARKVVLASMEGESRFLAVGTRLRQYVVQGVPDAPFNR